MDRKTIAIVLYEYYKRPFGQYSGTKSFLKEFCALSMTQTFNHAYDKFLMIITPDYEITLSGRMMGGAKYDDALSFFEETPGRQIVLPEKFALGRDFLAQHFEAYGQHP